MGFGSQPEDLPHCPVHARDARVGEVFPMRILALIASASLLSTASADLVLDLTASVGTGNNTAYAVIDFSATNYPVYAFSYSWDGEASVHDMLLALEAVGLGYEWTDWGTGIFADNFHYGSPAGDPNLYWAHSSGTIANGGPNWSDATTSVDLADLSDGDISGWHNGFNDDYSAIPPSLPLIPAPASFILLAGLGIARRRR